MINCQHKSSHVHTRHYTNLKHSYLHKRQTNNEQNSAEPKQEHQKLFLKLPTHAKLPK